MSEFFQFIKDLYTDIRDHFKPPTPVAIPPTPFPVYTSEEIQADLLKMSSDWYANISELVAAPVDEEIEAYYKLQELGFDKIEGMKDARDKKWEIDNAIKYKAMLDHYTPAYPTHPLIPRGLLDELCLKYGLIIGNTKEYVKDIPKRAMTEILAFKFKDEDRQLYHEYQGYYAHQNFWEPAKMPACITDQKKEELNAGKQVYVIQGNYGTNYQYRTQFVIVAPREHFSKDGKHIYAGCNDPIVLVEIGDKIYMIITMW